MSTPDSERSPLSDPLFAGLLAFVGAALGFLLLPRVLKTFLRRFVLGTLGEIVAIVAAGLLTEKAVDYITKDDE